MAKIPKIILLFENYARATEQGLLRGIVKYSSIYDPWAFYSRPGWYYHGLAQMDLKHLNVICPKKGFYYEF